MKLATGIVGSLLLCMCLAVPTMVQAGVINSTERTISDAALTTKVKTVLAENKLAHEYTVHVDSNNGTVTLTGHVGSRHNADQIAQLVRGVSGVRKVDNDLKTP